MACVFSLGEVWRPYTTMYVCARMDNCQEWKTTGCQPLYFVGIQKNQVAALPLQIWFQVFSIHTRFRPYKT